MQFYRHRFDHEADFVFNDQAAYLVTDDNIVAQVSVREAAIILTARIWPHLTHE